MNRGRKVERTGFPRGLQSWPLQLIEHLTNTTSVASPPAGPVGCRPLYFLHFLNLSSTIIWAPNRCCILQIRAFQSCVCNLFKLVLLGAKAKFLQRKPKVLVALDEISEIC